jgi:hypothetical protein
MILTSPGMTLLSEKPVLKCCVCGENEIPSPPGTVPSSRFFCRGCCELIWIARHIAEARDTSMEAALGIARDTIAKQSRLRWPVSNRTDSIAGRPPPPSCKASNRNFVTESSQLSARASIAIA